MRTFVDYGRMCSEVAGMLNAAPLLLLEDYLEVPENASGVYVIVATDVPLYERLGLGLPKSTIFYTGKSEGEGTYSGGHVRRKSSERHGMRGRLRRHFERVSSASGLDAGDFSFKCVELGSNVCDAERFVMERYAPLCNCFVKGFTGSGGTVWDDVHCSGAESFSDLSPRARDALRQFIKV